MESGVTIVLEPIEMDALEPVIQFAFAEDKDTHLFHEEPKKEIWRMAQHTYGRIAGQSGMKAFSVMLETDKKHLIGFTVVNTEVAPVLYSFGIRSEYRTRKNLTAWLGSVEQLLGRFYIVPLYNKNTRAIKFFEKNGFKIKQKDNEISFLCQ